MNIVRRGLATMGEVSRRMRIDVTSDVLCPFCLLGVKQLTLALETYNANHPAAPINPDIRILPYQLNPALTLEPVSKKEMYAKKFGKERAESLAVGMRARMAAHGYTPNPDGMTSSSHLAQRLQMYTLAHSPKKQLAVYMDLLEAYHIRGIAPSDRPTLAQIAVKHGLFKTEDEVNQWLDGNDCDEEVRKGYLSAQRLGITGVPFFVFQGKYAASGAMGVEEFVGLLEEISKREGAEGMTPSPTSTAVTSNPGDSVKA